jgi:hypothetical protein
LTELVGLSKSSYAALVTPTGNVTNLPNGGGSGSLPSIGIVNSVAISDTGVGLVGGLGDNTPFVVLVSPTGIITNLPVDTGGPLPTQGTIYTVAVATTDEILNMVVPQSIGPYASAIYSQLAASNVLTSHFITQFNWSHLIPKNEIHFVAAQELPPCKKEPIPEYSTWVAPFGSYIHLKHESCNPTLTNTVGGALAGFDYHFRDLLLGGGVGYAFNYVHYSEGLGHGKLQEELACFYTSYNANHVRVNAALWGGLYQFHNERHSLELITSTFSTNGFILSPHLEATISYNQKNCWIEPFATVDWTNVWQRHYSEKGKSGFNIVMQGQWTSLLQSELGLRFYEVLTYKWGECLFVEKFGYVNQAPFHFEKINAFFIGAVSTFPISTGSHKVQNLGSAQLVCSLSPKNQRFPYFSLDMQGQIGSAFQAYLVIAQLGKDF